MAKNRRKEATAKPRESARGLFWPRTEGDAAYSLRIVLACVADGELPPDWAVEEAAQALHRYDSAEVETIGEAFGFPWNKHLTAKRAEQLAPFLAARVKQVQEQDRKDGVRRPLSCPHGRGVYDVVGAEFKLSRANVKKYRDAWLAHKRELGITDREEQLAGANAGPVVFNALSRGLRKTPKK